MTAFVSKKLFWFALAFLGLGFTSPVQAAGLTLNYRTYATFNQRWVTVSGTLPPLAPGQQCVGVWIRTYDARGNVGSEGQINLNPTTLQFSGGIGDFQMASFAVVVRYRNGNGPIQTAVTTAYPWRP